VLPSSGKGIPLLCHLPQRVQTCLSASFFVWPCSALVTLVATAPRFDELTGTKGDGTTVPEEILDSIRRNGVCLKGTLFTPLDKSTSTQSLNVQFRKRLDLDVNLVHGFSVPALKTRHENLDIVVIRCCTEGPGCGRDPRRRSWWLETDTEHGSPQLVHACGGRRRKQDNQIGTRCPILQAK
jgi:Isocitrate/isopropylmalate dehydrogenase